MQTEKWVFVHNPKTAGSSIVNALGGSSDEPMHLPCRLCGSMGRPTFGFIRNPWDRLVSIHSFQVQRGKTRTSFREWLLHGEQRYEYDEEDLPRIQCREQMFWLDGCNFIGQYEDLEADLNTIMKILGHREKIVLEHLNKSEHAHYREYYDDEMREFVASWFAGDIALYNYEF